jgi:predicted dehydrogenase
MSSKLKVGILGCGAISEIYLKCLTGDLGDRVEVVAIADVMAQSAKKRGEQFNLPTTAPDELMSRSDVQLIANLTPAPVHYATTKSILNAGKHVYSEKPLALTWEEGVELVELAKRKNLRLSVAPDTLLGSGVQSTRQLIDTGAIGTVSAAQLFISLNNHTERYFGTFRGPLMDLGPYPIAAMLYILGPAIAVTGVALPLKQPDPALPEGMLTHTNPGNAAATVEFASGAVATILSSAQTSRYLITNRYFGSTGWIEAPDPNMFDGTIKMQIGYDAPVDKPLTHPFATNTRGVGIWDMADAIANHRPHRLGADLSLHTLEVMLAVVASHQSGARVKLKSSFESTPLLPIAT